MRSPMPRKCAAGAAPLVALLLMNLMMPCPASAQDSVGEDLIKQPLVPCLAVAADGVPIYPSMSFTPSKRLTVAFRLKEDESAKVLHSRWFAVDENDTMVAENKLDLHGQKDGVLRLLLRQPAPPGKYRLEVMLDDKEWQTVEVQVTPPLEQGKVEKPTDLIPLTEGKTQTYELISRPGESSTTTIPGVEPGPDGVSRATLTITIGKTDDTGTHYVASINGEPISEMWVKLDEKGLQAVRAKSGEQTKALDAPRMLQPLPPSLESGTEWTSPTKDGGEQKLQVFGPLPLEGPAGPTPGYIIFSQEQKSVGRAGSSSARGLETVERHYIADIGLVHEIHVSTLGGKVGGRQEITLVPSTPYKLVANPQMKGRLGRVVFEYPPETKSSEARVAVFKADAKEKDKPVHSGYGQASFDLMPGKYEVSMNNKRVPVEVKSGHDTILRCGVLRVHAGTDTRYRVFDKDKKSELFSGYGNNDIALPVGTYFIEIAGSTEQITIGEGQVVEF